MINKLGTSAPIISTYATLARQTRKKALRWRILYSSIPANLVKGVTAAKIHVIQESMIK